ncbi:GNAT family N-acetyltransferase [Paenibacillus donghaensis]|uniref:GNAT family N-acetyltransferase n=1 Tax=Paenibacillus donghaensis TaxID=414771 RepID=UPI0018838C6E|nr:GNAT family N-acetyltransferase [Paenibacillus donghaensis]MBE9914263.1 GNAT family N-acetyltransferase [Paenibacillus donghaensis]
MAYLEITKENIGHEHICCALGAKQYEQAVQEKKQWLCERMEEGLKFHRLDERAKVFIEYLPADKAWVPINAPNYMYINCLWVSGRHKGSGHSKKLLEQCRKDAESLGMDGIVHIASSKKMPYLSDKRYFEHMGFTVADQADPYFVLLVQKWNEHGADPAFIRSAQPKPALNEGICIYYTAQCPFAAGVLDDLQGVADHRGILFRTKRISTREEAQESPAIWTTFSMFYNGKFVTHEIMSPGKFEKMLDSLK